MRGRGHRLAVVGLAASAVLGAPGTPAVAGDLCGPRSVSISDSTVAESDGLMNFTLLSSGCAGGTTNFQALAGAGGFAAATVGGDFVAASGQVSWAAGETATKTISVGILNDAAVEADEGLTLVLHSPSGLSIMDGSGQGVILDDDGPNSSLDLSISEPFCGTETCVSCWLKISLNRPATFPVSVRFATLDGTATGGTDFVAADTRVTIPAGATETRIQVPILDDAKPEPTQYFVVSISQPSAGQIATGQLTITIIDDDT